MSTSAQAGQSSPATRTTSDTHQARSGVGYSDRSDSREAGAEAARLAMQHAGIERCDLVMLFCTSKHDAEAFRDGVRSVVGREPRLFGGSSVGSITNDRIGYFGFEVGVAVIAAPEMRAELFVETDLDTRGEHAVGAALGRQIASHTYDGEPSVVLLYDSVRRAGVELNMATAILAAMSESVAPWPNVAGVGVFGDMQFSSTVQWADDRVLSQAALALVLHGSVRMDTIIMHGCKPSGRYHTVTKTDGPVVLEIDGRPALDLLGEMVPDKSWEEYPLFLTLGVNKGDKFGEFREEDYANRLCMSIDHERGGLVMFEPDLLPGSEVQLMRRSIDLQYMSARVDRLFEQVGERRPFFALYIDCAGRASALCGSDGEEAEEVQKALTARGVPLLGMYSGVEIAKVGGHVQALDWTGVLCVFSE